MTIKQFFTTRTVILLALASMMILSVISYNSLLKLNSLSNAVDHTHVVQLNLQKTYSALSDADNEFKSFLITKDSVYYHGWVKEKTFVDQSLTQLRKLTDDNARQRQRIVSLDSLVEARRAYMDASMKADESHYEYFSARIEECNVRLEKSIEILNAEEEKLLQERTDRSSQYQVRAPFTLLAFQIAVVLCLLTGFILVTADLRARKKLQRTLELSNKELKSQRDFYSRHFR